MVGDWYIFGYVMKLFQNHHVTYLINDLSESDTAAWSAGSNLQNILILIFKKKKQKARKSDYGLIQKLQRL